MYHFLDFFRQGGKKFLRFLAQAFTKPEIDPGYGNQPGKNYRTMKKHRIRKKLIRRETMP